MQLVDRNFVFRNLFDDSSDNTAAWQQKQAEEAFPVQDTGGPTLVEKQRVLRAFWRVQLFRNLVAHIEEGDIKWPKRRFQAQEHTYSMFLQYPMAAID